MTISSRPEGMYEAVKTDVIHVIVASLTAEMSLPESMNEKDSCNQPQKNWLKLL